MRKKILIFTCVILLLCVCAASVRAQSCAIRITAPSGGMVSGDTAITLAETHCGRGYNRLQVTGATETTHFDFTGTSYALAIAVGEAVKQASSD